MTSISGVYDQLRSHTHSLTHSAAILCHKYLCLEAFWKFLIVNKPKPLAMSCNYLVSFIMSIKILKPSIAKCSPLFATVRYSNAGTVISLSASNGFKRMKFDLFSTYCMKLIQFLSGERKRQQDQQRKLNSNVRKPHTYGCTPSDPWNYLNNLIPHINLFPVLSAAQTKSLSLSLSNMHALSPIKCMHIHRHDSDDDEDNDDDDESVSHAVTIRTACIECNLNQIKGLCDV